MRSSAHSLKFCGALARVACFMLALIASCVMFHCFFESTSTKQYSTLQSFSGAKDSSFSQIPIYDRYTLL